MVRSVEERLSVILRNVRNRMPVSPLSVVLVAAVVGMGVAFLVWLHRDRPGAGPLAVFVVTASLWTVTYGLELAVPDVGTMAWLRQVQLTISVVIPVAWLVTVLEYTGQPYWLTRRRVALLLVEPLVYVTLVWSNSAHGLVWAGATTTVVAGTNSLVPAWEVAYWAHLAYMLTLVLAGGALLLRMMLHTNRLFRSQGLALLLAITVPIALKSLFAVGVLPTNVDPTSVGYVFSGVVLSVVLLQGQLLDVAPVTRDLGREAIFAEMDDRVVIVDEGGRIVDVNDAAADLFGDDPVSLPGRSLVEELPALADAVPETGEQGQLETSVDHDGLVRHYDVRVTPLYRAYGAVSGHLISLRDVTERRQREQRLDVLNRLLRHDIRNEMNVVRGNADLLADSVDGDGRDRIDRIIGTVDTVVERSNKIGRVSEALESEQRRPVDLWNLLDPVVRKARERYPDADISVTGPEVCWVEAGPSLTLAIEELLDNAIEHGEGPVTVTVTAEESERPDGVCIRVHDEGPGIAAHEREVILSGEETPLQHGSGVGLWLVNWVVRNVGGTLSFPDVEGTTVEIALSKATPVGDGEGDADTTQRAATESDERPAATEQLADANRDVQ